MRRFQGAALAAVAVLGLASVASAADMAPAARAPVYKAPIAPPIFSWTGCYLGGQAGYTFGSSDPTWQATGFASLPDGTPLTATLHPNGALGGLTAGCNYQWSSNWVVGVEGDFSWMHANSSNPLLPPANTAHTFSATEHWLATARARVGYTMGSYLLFVTGGAAFASLDTTDLDTTSGISATETTSRTGWTIGGGLEYALAAHWSVKGEYLYADLGTKRILNPELGSPTDVPLKQQLVLAGVNYKF
jgi:outer membrane immunogenic protein